MAFPGAEAGSETARSLYSRLLTGMLVAKKAPAFLEFLFVDLAAREALLKNIKRRLREWAVRRQTELAPKNRTDC